MGLFQSEDLIFLLQSIRCEDHMIFMFMSQKPSAYRGYGMTASLQHIPGVPREELFPSWEGDMALELI